MSKFLEEIRIALKERKYKASAVKRVYIPKREIKKNMEDGLHAIYDADLKGYFDTIPHDKLLLCVMKRIVDKSLIKLIRMWLQAPIVESGKDGKPKVSSLDFLGYTFLLFADMSEKEDLNAITGMIIKCAYSVSNTLGVGFLEKVYENSLMIVAEKNTGIVITGATTVKEGRTTILQVKLSENPGMNKTVSFSSSNTGAITSLWSKL